MIQSVMLAGIAGSSLVNNQNNNIPSGFHVYGPLHHPFSIPCLWQINKIATSLPAALAFVRSALLKRFRSLCMWPHRLLT